MLIPMPAVMRKNPNCYKVEFEKGFVPTESATDEERKAIAEYNKKCLDAEKQINQVIGAPI